METFPGTGLHGLDKILCGLRKGDNVVWQVDRIDDFINFVTPFVKKALTRSREEDDDRDDLPAYALLNLSLIAKEFFKTMEIQGTVFNLLDKDYSDPGTTSVPEDLPRPGRTFFVGLSYQF